MLVVVCKPVVMNIPSPLPWAGGGSIHTNTVELCITIMFMCSRLYRVPLSTGLAQPSQQAIAGTLAGLSWTPMHSLRHRLVRSRQSAHEDVLGFLRF